MKSAILMVMFLPTFAYALDLGAILDPSNPYVILGFLILEYVMGKTDWVKANSVVELVINLALKMFKKEEKV